MTKSLGFSDVDTVWASPPISKSFSAIFSPSHIKLTNNNPNKDFEATVGSQEI